VIAAVAIIAAYAIGSIPVPYLAGRLAKGVDIREQGSGNVGTSNVWQTVSKPLVVPVGLAQIAQGCAGPLIARALGEGVAVQVAAGLAAVVAHNWCPWLRFSGGRGIGPAIGVLLVLSPWALGVFVVLALVGVVTKAVPQLMALGLVLTPAAAAAAGDPSPVIAGCAALAAIVLLKRVVANGPPEPEYARPGVLRNRLIFDRDIPDRESWIRRAVTR
jgi:acyl phosphate:glycerol-3-phosphate acyltransferase